MTRKVEATRRLPKRFQTLRYALFAWDWERMLGMPEGVEFPLPSYPAFVRHHYTNYDELLSALTWGHQEEYQAIKAEATTLAEQMLSDAYGDKWKVGQ